MTFGGNQYSYVKDVHNEQWDDYQLRSVCFGGNQPLFNLFKEYQIDTHPMSSRYRHASVTWYRKRHMALMDGIVLSADDHPKPAKDWDERVAQTKTALMKTRTQLTKDLGKAGASIKVNGLVAGQVISERASVAGHTLSIKGQ